MELLYTPSSAYKNASQHFFSECIININNLFSLQCFFRNFYVFTIILQNFNRVNLAVNRIVKTTLVFSETLFMEFNSNSLGIMLPGHGWFNFVTTSFTTFIE